MLYEFRKTLGISIGVKCIGVFNTDSYRWLLYKKYNTWIKVNG